MPILKGSESCSGCSACKNICPTKAITMNYDEEGFKIPIVDDNKCINCNICEKVCPENTKENVVIIKNKAYAMQNRNNDIRFNSASGAFFPAMAKYFLENNGYIVGCLFDDNLMPIHKISNNEEDIKKMQDSKYVQSDMKSCFTEIANLLKEGNKVFFTGTSCQVSGLKSFLLLKKIDSSNLLTVDFFCHGVPSPKIWKEYLNFYSKTQKKDISGYRFRCKKYGWGEASRGTYHLNTVKYKNNKKEDNVTLAARMWRSIFFSNLVLRKYCSICPYTTVNKPADITMGDFWGIEDIDKEFDDGKGTSLLISHNKKGEEYISILKKIKNIEIKEENLELSIKRQANAFSPSKINFNKRQQFWVDYNNHGFRYCAEKYYNYNWKTRVKGIVKRVLFETKLRRNF